MAGCFRANTYTGKYKQIREILEPLPDRRFDSSIVRVPYVPDYGTAYVEAYEQVLWALNRRDRGGFVSLQTKQENFDTTVPGSILRTYSTYSRRLQHRYSYLCGLYELYDLHKLLGRLEGDVTQPNVYVRKHSTCSWCLKPHSHMLGISRSPRRPDYSLSPEVAIPENLKSTLLSLRKKVRTRCRSAPHKRSLAECSSPFMRPAERVTVLRAWCKQSTSAWSAKPRRAPSRHCRNAGACNHMTTAMHDMSAPPPLVGMRGSMIIRLRPCMIRVPPPNPVRSLKLSSICQSASQTVLSRMQLTLHATRRAPHGASRLGASNVCLVGENPTCSVPALSGCEGLWSYDYGHA